MPVRKLSVLAVIVVLGCVGTSFAAGEVTLAIDLDRNTPGIQSQLGFDELPANNFIQAAVVITNNGGDARFDPGANPDAGPYLRNFAVVCEIDPVSSVIAGTMPFVTRGQKSNDFDPPVGSDMTNVSNGWVGFAGANISQYNESTFELQNLPVGVPKVLCFINIRIPEGLSDTTTVSVRTSNPATDGITMQVPDGAGSTVAMNSDVYELIPAVIGGEPVDTPTPEPPSHVDGGLWLMDVFGGRHDVGAPPAITGNVYFPGNEIAAAFARNNPTYQLPATELYVLENNGVVHAVAGGSSSVQVSSQRRAVDLAVAGNGTNWWVLTSDGLVFDSAGNEVISISDIGPDVPVPGRDELGWDPTGASLRAVALEVIDNGGAAAGFLVLLSNGHLHRFGADGGEPPLGAPAILFAEGPAFPGLDIARDITLTPAQDEALILDGWGGYHPVPAAPDPTSYLGQLVLGDPNTRPTHDLPYVPAAFENYATAVSETMFAADVGSIFVALQFVSEPGSPGFYEMDVFGSIFTAGAARSEGGANHSLPAGWAAPYFTSPEDLASASPGGYWYAKDFAVFEVSN